MGVSPRPPKPGGSGRPGLASSGVLSDRYGSDWRKDGFSFRGKSQAGAEVYIERSSSYVDASGPCVEFSIRGPMAAEAALKFIELIEGGKLDLNVLAELGGTPMEAVAEKVRAIILPE